jgi:nitrate reductase gamma subunit
MDGGLMMRFGEWAQRILTFRGGAVEQLAGAGVLFKLHMFLGMTIFLVFPFTRLVHVWSGFASVAYVWRPYQVVRTKRRIARAQPARTGPAGTTAHPVPEFEPRRAA